MKMRTRTYALLVVLLIINSLRLNMSSAETQITAVTSNDCSCKQNDSLAKSQCGPEPKKLKKNVFKPNAGDVCAKPTWQQSSGIYDLFNLNKKISIAVEDSKSANETLDYISCYRPSDRHFCHYKNTLAPHILLAAESAGLPFSVQSCLFMRESGFDPKSTSPKGALGYVQFMPSTVSELRSVIFGKISDWEKDIERTKKYLLDVNQKLTTEKDKKLVIFYTKEKNYYEAHIKVCQAKIAAKPAWDQYWEGSAVIPKRITNEDLKCPQVAFALAAVKQKYDLGLIEDFDVKEFVSMKGEHQISINQLGVRDSAILLAGGYNAGIAGIGNHCGSVKSLDECIKKIPIRETKNYMTSIRTCAEKDSTLPMSGDTAKDCKASKCTN